MNTLTAIMVAAYPNAMIEKEGKIYPLSVIDVYCKDDLSIRIRDKRDINDWCNLYECRLVLTPLAKITSDQALSMARLYIPQFADTIYETKITAKQIEWCFFYGEGRDSIIMESEEAPRRILDYARRENIDFGYDTIPSLIDAGLAIEAKEGML